MSIAGRTVAGMSNSDAHAGEGRQWWVYLAGEIHTDWRAELERAAHESGLPVAFTSAVLDHEASDSVGTAILGAEESARWRDHKGAQINAIRTRTHLNDADVVVVRFALGENPGGSYRQWNTAFDAGYAAALGKPIIALHAADGAHALKELDAAALAVASTTEQVIEILRYVTG